MNDPMIDLVCNAMGYGVMMALESRDELLRKLQAQPSNGSLADALRSNAEAFIKTRADLTEALSVQIDTRPRVGQGGADAVHDHCYGGGEADA